jgi:hypothetical protein
VRLAMEYLALEATKEAMVGDFETDCEMFSLDVNLVRAEATEAG